MRSELVGNAEAKVVLVLARLEVLVGSDGPVAVDLVDHFLVGLKLLAGDEGGLEGGGLVQVVGGTESELDGLALEASGLLGVVVLGLPGVGDAAAVDVVATSVEVLLGLVETEPVVAAILLVVDNLTEELGNILGVVLSGETDVDLVLKLNGNLRLEEPLLLALLAAVLEAQLYS